MAISITYLGSTSDAGGSGTTLSVDNIDTTGAKALVIAAKHDGAATTITPRGNSDATGWTSLPKRSYSGGEPHAQIFYKLNPTGAVGDDPQIVLAASRSWKYLAVWKITADTDVELIDETSAEGVGTSRNAGNLVATAASVAVYLDTIWTGGAHTPGGTWTERYDVDAGAFDRTGTGAETYAASSTFSGGDLWVGVAAAFQEVGSGAAPVSAGNRFRPGLHPAAGPFNPAQFMPRRGSRDNPATGGGIISTDVAGRVRVSGAAGSSKIGATDILARVAVRGAEAANKIGGGSGSGQIAIGAAQASAKFGSASATGLVAVRASSSYSVGGIPSTDISVALRIVGSSTAIKLGTSDQSARVPVRGVAAGAKIGAGSAAGHVAIRASSSFAPPGVGSTDLAALLQIRASSTATKLGATAVLGRVAVRGVVSYGGLWSDAERLDYDYYEQAYLAAQAGLTGDDDPRFLRIGERVHRMRTRRRKS